MKIDKTILEVVLNKILKVDSKGAFGDLSGNDDMGFRDFKGGAQRSTVPERIISHRL